MNVLRERDYVRLEKNRLVPEDRGRLVTAFLESFFERYVEYDFTADLEEKLDRISAGDLEWKQVLRDFWREFIGAVDEIKDLRVSEVLEALNEILGPHIFPDAGDGTDPRACPSCADGRLSLKVGKFGAFIGCSNYPECRYTRQLGRPGEDGQEGATPDKIELGHDPETGEPVTLRSGRFGPYVQLGEAQNGEKPKRASVPKGMDPAQVTLDMALQLLSLPRDVGPHPETGKPIVAGIGRYGPFVEHAGKYANLDSADEVFTVGLNRAVSLLAEAKTRRPRGGTVLKELGEHPELGGAIQVCDGRYGPYVKHGKINATLPKDADPSEVSVEKAVELIAAKAEKSGKKPAKAKSGAKSGGQAKTAAKSAKKPATKTESSGEEKTGKGKGKAAKSGNGAGTKSKSASSKSGGGRKSSGKKAGDTASDSAR
jgi:DNA topoisomerase-1